MMYSLVYHVRVEHGSWYFLHVYNTLRVKPYSFNPFPTLYALNAYRVLHEPATTPRAASDRPRALDYMVWMRTIDN